MGMLESGAAQALNHLLSREAWARAKLAPFAGEIVELRCAPLPPLRLAIAEGGTAALPPEAGPVTLTISAKPGFFAALSRGEDHLMRAVEISGNAHLAGEILALLRYLRWDVEEDLSKVLGDVVAHRLVGAVREFAGWQAEAGRRAAENLVDYAVEERRLIVARAEFERFAAEVAALRDDLARLEQRAERLPAASPDAASR